jgi:hypothetical protein
VKRSLRATEFKEKFEAFNTKLKCVPLGLPGVHKRGWPKSWHQPSVTHPGAAHLAR